jgi:hypothetical protein
MDHPMRRPLHMEPRALKNRRPEMDLREIPHERFSTGVFDLFSRKWMLLTAGDFKSGDFTP